ncbi:MAG TPA: 3'-5' exonuclease [Anaerolineales bacterium]|nr:3'-5' exonuclease [Anaerolineales bacterium]
MQENAAASRSQAILEARRKIANQPLYLDTETTGLDQRAQIVEICLLDHDGSVLLESLVHPTNRIPIDATRVHGITDATVQGAPRWSELWPQVQAILAGRSIAVYNAEFDQRMMRQSHLVHGLPWEPASELFFCVMQLYARFYGEWDSYRGSYRWQRLEDAGRHLRLPLPNKHRAQADAQLARAVLHAIANQT